MHLIFSEAAKYPKVVDLIVNVFMGRDGQSKEPNFSKVFHKLFPAERQLHPNMQSFLAILSSFTIFWKNHESWEKDKDHLPTQKDWDISFQIFHHFGILIQTETDSSVWLFWACLIKLYREILDSPENHRPSFHNIFEFMNGFPITETRVVIIGHDPSPICESSGYAFHGSACKSTKNMILHLNKEQKLISDFLDDEDSIEIPEQDNILKDYLKKCLLDGWIRQGVLMFNSCFTRGHLLWKYVSGFLIKYLSDTFPHLVFILAGDKDEQEWIIDKSKHLILRLNHPGGCRDLEVNDRWEYNLPLLASNFFLYQLSLGDKTYKMINWRKISGDENNEAFMEKLKQLFSSMYNHAKDIPEDVLSITGDYVMPNPEREDKYKRSLLIEKSQVISQANNHLFIFTYYDYLKDARQFGYHKYRKLCNVDEAFKKQAISIKNNMDRTIFHEAFSRGYMDKEMFNNFFHLSDDLSYVDKNGRNILQTVRMSNIKDNKEYYIDELIKLGAKDLQNDEAQALPETTRSEESQIESNINEEGMQKEIEENNNTDHSPNKKLKTEL